MKEDAQLLCPISYEDPGNMWNLLEKEITSRFPLRDVTWRSPISNTSITIDRLPLRCLPITASLFKDTDHPFRWFLAPYIYTQLIVCESLDAYKTMKPNLRTWVEAHSGLKRSSWLLIYVPMGSQPIDTYQKIYAKISTEFCQDKTGDRSCMVLLNGFFKNLPPHSNTFAEVINKIRDGVILSFQQRCGQYDAEIRRLDFSRSSAQFDFKQLFLVKESLALMYQMMQLPSEALVQYEELEVLMDSYAPTALPETNWPLFSTSASSSSKPSAAAGGGSTTERQSEAQAENAAPSYIDKEIRGLWYEPAFQGDAVLTYSINHARMRVLKNKMGIIELTHYVFARECFFYFGLGRAALCAEKAMNFLNFAENHLKRRLESGSLLRSTQLDAVAATGEAIKLDTKTLSAMIDLWAVTAVVRIARSCREFSQEAKMKGRGETDLDTSTGTSLPSSPHFAVETTVGSPSNRAANNSSGSNATPGINREAPRSLCNLLQYAYGKLVSSLLTRSETSMSTQRKKAFDLTMLVSSWRDIAAAFKGNSAILDVIPDKIVSVNPVLKQLKTSSRHFLIYPGSKTDNERIEKLDEILSTFSKALRHMMQAAHLLSTVPRPEPQQMSVCNTRSNSPVPTAVSPGGTAGVTSSPLVAVRSSSSDAAVSPATAEPLKSRQSMSGVATAWFTAEAKLPLLEAQVSVTLARLLAEHEGEAGRLRLAFQSVSDCADVLICSGRFDYAKDMLLSALAIDNSLLLTSGMAGSATSTRIGGPLPEVYRRNSMNGNVGSSKRQSVVESFSTLSAALGNVAASAGGISTLNYSAPVGGIWKTFRYVTLRKLLLCARVLNDSMLYIDISLRLLDPLMKDLLSRNAAESIFSDVLSISRGTISSPSGSTDEPTDNDATSIEGGSLSTVLPAPMFPHLSISIKFSSTVKHAKGVEAIAADSADPGSAATEGNTSGLEDRIKSQQLRLATMRSVTSIIHDEPFKVSYAECEAGRNHISYLSITSSFPHDVTLDNLMVSYIPFSLLENGQHSPLQKHGGLKSPIGIEPLSEGANNIGSDFFRHQSFQSFHFGGDTETQTDTAQHATSPGQGSSHFTSGHINTGFECHPYFSQSERDGSVNRKLVLKPGHQVVPMCFTAKAVGEYAPLFISAQIGKLILVERIDADANKLHDFFDSNTLISIIKPADPITLSVMVPPLCPIGYKDTVLVGIGLEENDELHDVEVSVHSVHIDSDFLQSLALVDDAQERELLLSQYVDGSGEPTLYEDENKSSENGSSYTVGGARHTRIDSLVKEYLQPGNLAENKILPGTSPRTPERARQLSHISRDISDKSGQGGSSGVGIGYSVFVGKPSSWEQCENSGVQPPRPGTVPEKQHLLASAFPHDSVRIIKKVSDVTELILSVPVAAAPLLKKPPSLDPSSLQDVLVDLPGCNDKTISALNDYTDACFAIVCNVRGLLRRNFCETEFECRTQSLLRCGIAATVSQESIGLVDKEFFHQCVIKNRSSVSLVLNSIRVRPWASGTPCNRIELINDDICDLKLLPPPASHTASTENADWSEWKERCLSLGLSLRSTDCYFFSGRFSEFAYTATAKQPSRFLFTDYGRRSPGGTITDVAAKPAVVNFMLGRPRSEWVVGSNAVLKAVKNSNDAGIVEKDTRLNYFKEFLGTYDHDIFGHVITVSTAKSEVEDVLQFSPTEPNSKSPSQLTVDTSSCPANALSGKLAEKIRVKSGLPQDCVVSVTLDEDADVMCQRSRLNGCPNKRVSARIGLPMRCTYKIKLLHHGSGGHMRGLENCDIMRHILTSVCETDAWLPIGAVSESFNLMSLNDLERELTTSTQVLCAAEESLTMNVVLIPLRSGLLPLPPVQYIYSCTYFDVDTGPRRWDQPQSSLTKSVGTHESNSSNLPADQLKANAKSRAHSADSGTNATHTPTRRKSHIMSTPEQLGMTLLQQQNHIASSPTDASGGKKMHGMSFDPLLSFPEACILVPPDTQVIVPAFPWESPADN